MTKEQKEENEKKVEKWLRANSDLPWKLAPGDTPAKGIDREFLNRGEAYEFPSIIIAYYDTCKKKYIDKNFAMTFNKIIDYRKGEKVKRKEFIDYLIDDCKSKANK